MAQELRGTVSTFHRNLCLERVMMTHLVSSTGRCILQNIVGHNRLLCRNEFFAHLWRNHLISGDLCRNLWEEVYGGVPNRGRWRVLKLSLIGEEIRLIVDILRDFLMRKMHIDLLTIVDFISATDEDVRASQIMSVLLKGAIGLLVVEGRRRAVKMLKIFHGVATIDYVTVLKQRHNLINVPFF